MLSSYGILVLASLTVALHVDGAEVIPATHTKQTDWQKALLHRVEQNAIKLSEEATPILLERLDSDAFRAELAECCPSMQGLTARELLRQLQEQVSISEVISGFPAVSDTVNMFPDSPGMSVADGLAGNFFQNAWQAVLLHTEHPLDVFHRTFEDHIVADCSETSETVRFEQWSSPGCKGWLMQNGTYPQDKCMYDPGDNLIFQYHCEGIALIEDDWSIDQLSHSLKRGGANHRRYRRQVSPPSSYPIVACPSRPADSRTKYTADNKCQSYVAYNASTMWTLEDNAELHSYGLKPFALPGAPQTLQEAAERGPYALVNDFLLDAGSPLYGDVSAVFSFQAMRRTALLSAVDSGSYEGLCVRHSPLPMQEKPNCSVYEPLQGLGTFQHFNHLFLVNDDYWNEGYSILARRFARLEGDWGTHKLAAKDLIHYWEALPAGTVQYPEDVRFLIGSFPSLFGTKEGAQLQKWAKQRKWVLLWTLGLNLEGQQRSMDFSVLSTNLTFKANQRLMDAEVALETTAASSLSILNSTRSNFSRHWNQVASLRKSHYGYVSNATWALQWQELMDSTPSAMHLRPLRGGDCARPPTAPECVGVSADQRCICYADKTLDDTLVV